MYILVTSIIIVTSQSNLKKQINPRVSVLSKKRQRNENIPNADEKKTVKTIENQRVSDLSTKRHRSENIPNADEKKVRLFSVFPPTTKFFFEN